MSSRWEGHIERVEAIIVVAGIAAIAIFLALWLALGIMVMQEAHGLGGVNVTRQDCISLFFDDTSTTGYVEETASQCWKLLQ